MSEELKALADDLDAMAGIGPPNSNGKTLISAASALRRLAAAGEQKPFAWYSSIDPVQPFVKDYQREDMRPERAARYDRPLYTAPQPAPGWDGAIEAAAKHIEMRPGSCPDRKAIAEELRALRRSSQSTSDAGGGVRCADWDDPRVQLVYEILCDTAEPPEGEHWEGFAARRIIDALSNPAAADSTAPWPDPTLAMLDGDALFDAIWQTIKSWDVNVPAVYSGYCGANGNHVRAIYDAVKSAAADSNAGAAARLREALYRHKKRGTTYRVLHDNAPMQEEQTEGRRLDDEPMVVYQDVNSNAVYVRPVVEFYDGRFEALSTDPHASDCEKQGETTKSIPVQDAEPANVAGRTGGAHPPTGANPSDRHAFTVGRR